QIAYKCRPSPRSGWRLNGRLPLGGRQGGCFGSCPAPGVFALWGPRGPFLAGALPWPKRGLAPERRGISGRAGEDCCPFDPGSSRAALNRGARTRSYAREHDAGAIARRRPWAGVGASRADGERPRSMPSRNLPLYEHVFLARQDISQAQVETLTKEYAGVIEEGGGRIGKTEYWGLKTLAFKIKKNRKAHYTLMNITAPPAAITEMERRMGISSDVIRFLTVRVDAHETEP